MASEKGRVWTHSLVPRDRLNSPCHQRMPDGIVAATLKEAAEI